MASYFRFLMMQCILVTAACSSPGAKSWEREVLAQEDILMDANALDLAIDEHIYFSKEASSGGQEFSGGGCGCN